VRESISGRFVWGIWNNPLFGGLSLCTSTAYLQKTSFGKSARFLWKIPEIENLENCSVYWFFRVFPVIKGLGECRDEGKLHFPVKIFRIITVDSVRDTWATGITWKFEKSRRSLSSFLDSIYFRCTRLLFNENIQVVSPCVYHTLSTCVYYKTRSTQTFQKNFLN